MYYPRTLSNPQVTYYASSAKETCKTVRLNQKRDPINLNPRSRPVAWCALHSILSVPRARMRMYRWTSVHARTHARTHARSQASTSHMHTLARTGANLNENPQPTRRCAYSREAALPVSVAVRRTRCRAAPTHFGRARCWYVLMKPNASPGLVSSAARTASDLQELTSRSCRIPEATSAFRSYSV